MNVYRKEFRDHFRSLLLWGLGILFFIAASAGKYSAMAGDPAALGIFTQMPLGLQAVFGVGRLDFTKAVGFYGVLYSYLTLMAAIHASMLGAVILSKEERDKTSEFLYVKPRSRESVLTAKLLAALTMVALLNLTTWACSAGMVRAFGEQADGLILRLMAGLFLLQLLFLACGLAAAAVSTHPRAATGIAAGVMLSAYILSVAIEVNGGIDWLKILTPFAYFDAKRIVGGGEPLSLLYVLLCVALTAGLTGWAYLRFPRRDVRV
ncbi:MAG: ABC transporter permease subunit [Clostridiales bacterium]|nr:ABC transporter permease subunit [Clostridiales bacterium]